MQKFSQIWRCKYLKISDAYVKDVKKKGKTLIVV